TPYLYKTKNSQKAIIKVIKDVFPQHGVLAEEDGVNEISKDYCWIIDPLDDNPTIVFTNLIYTVFFS
ncbi:MAG: hypothetical protein LE178_06675, partial [Endomicrobium sp.]|nr:hypothetical protein [Endomicrobium sp.]